MRSGSESNRSEGSNLEMSVFTVQTDLEAVIAMMKARSGVDSRNIFLHLFMMVGRPYFERLFDYDVYGHIQNYFKDILLIHGGRTVLSPSLGIVKSMWSLRQDIHSLPPV